MTSPVLVALGEIVGTLGRAGPGGLRGLEQEGRGENCGLNEAHRLGKVTEAGTCLLGLVDVETHRCFTGTEQGVRLELQAEDVGEAEEGGCVWLGWGSTRMEAEFVE